MQSTRALLACLVFIAASGCGTSPDPQPTLGQRTQAPYMQAVQVLPSGTRIVQYIDRRGTVFAVTWSGPDLPELRTLLGTHYTALLDAQARSSLHAPVVVRTDRVVIVSAGTAGAFSGRAWLPTRLPAAFDPKDLS